MKNEIYFNDIRNKEKAAREMFKNHIAKFVTNKDNLKIIDWRNKDGSNNCYIRYFFDEDNYTLSTHGDLGKMSATNYWNMTYENVGDFFGKYSYFIEKMESCKYGPWEYDAEEAINDFIEYYFDETFPGNQFYKIPAIDVKLTDSKGNVKYYARDLGKSLSIPKSDTTLLDVFDEIATQEGWNMSSDGNQATFTNEEELDDDNVVTPEMEYEACIVNGITLEELEEIEPQPCWTLFPDVESVRDDLREHFDYRDDGGLIISDQLGEWLNENGYSDYWEGLSSFGRRVHPRVIEWLIGLEMAKAQLESTINEPYFGKWVSLLAEDGMWVPLLAEDGISCHPESKLPEKDGEYLITTHDGKVEKARYSQKAGWDLYHGEIINYAHDMPIAWMPMPEPYRGEK